MDKATSICGTHWNNVATRALLYQIYHVTKIAPIINGFSQKWYLTKRWSHQKGLLKLTLFVFKSTSNTLLIELTPTIRQKLEKVDFKIPWYVSELHNKFKNSFFKITQITWQLIFELFLVFFKVCHFCKALFCVVAVVFVYFRWSICYVPLL